MMELQSITTMLKGKVLYILLFVSFLSFGQQRNKMLQASIQQASAGSGPTNTPTYVQSWSNNVVNNVNNTVAMTPTDNNLLVATVELNSSSNPISAPGDWTQMHQSNSAGSIAVFYKIASSTTSATFTASSAFTDNFGVTIREFTNVDTSTPFEALVSTAVVGSQTGVTIPSMTSTGAKRLAISLVIRPYSDDNLSSGPSSYTSAHTYSTTNAGDSYSELFTYSQDGVGSTPTDPLTYSTSDPLGIVSMLLIGN